MTDIGKEEKIRVFIYSQKKSMGGETKTFLGIVAVDAKQCRVGYARGGVKKNSRRGGVVEVKNTQEGCLMHSYSLGKCKGGVCDSKKGGWIIGGGG